MLRGSCYSHENLNFVGICNIPLQKHPRLDPLTLGWQNILLLRVFKQHLKILKLCAKIAINHLP